jgi:hypothetical protein
VGVVPKKASETSRTKDEDEHDVKQNLRYEAGERNEKDTAAAHEALAFDKQS